MNNGCLAPIGRELHRTGRAGIIRPMDQPKTRPAPGGGGTRYFDLIMAAFVTVLIVSNIASTKIVNFGPFTFDGGTLLFPASYIFGDILTEVYGYGRARRVIWTGFFAAGLMALVLAVVGALPAAGDWPHQESFEAILGEFSNSFILSKMKIRTGGASSFSAPSDRPSSEKASTPSSSSSSPLPAFCPLPSSGRSSYRTTSSRSASRFSPHRRPISPSTGSRKRRG